MSKPTMSMYARKDDYLDAVENYKHEHASLSPTLIDAAERAYFAIGRMGANHDLDHPLRVNWEELRRAIKAHHKAKA